MPDVDEYLRLAALQFQTAIGHFEEAEDTLRNLEVKLEGCLERLRKLNHDESLPVNQPDTLVYDSQPIDGELHPVSP